jgi:hypothetical protein
VQAGELTDSLDEPLHLRILTSLASSLARHPPTAELGHQPQPTLPGDLDIITGGLPETSRATSVEVDDDDQWVGGASRVLNNDRLNS